VASGLVSCLIVDHPNVLSQNLKVDPIESQNLSHARGSDPKETQDLRPSRFQGLCLQVTIDYLLASELTCKRESALLGASR
jgi:hypothetical protein